MNQSFVKTNKKMLEDLVLQNSSEKFIDSSSALKLLKLNPLNTKLKIIKTLLSKQQINSSKVIKGEAKTTFMREANYFRKVC